MIKTLETHKDDFKPILGFMRALGVNAGLIKELGKIIKKSRFIYAVSNEVFEVADSIDDNFLYAGTLLGEVKKEFMPSPEFVDFLSKHSSNKITVNPKSEWMFLCKKDIFKSGVLKDTSDRKARKVFVQTVNGENIGLAFAFKEGKYLHIIDKGAYVRKEI
jgi:ribosome biogenesis protein Nip4